MNIKKINNKNNFFFASCPKGLEDFLFDDAIELGIPNSDLKLLTGGLEFKTSNINALNFLLQSRVASRVFRVLSKFSLKNEKEIYDWSKQQSWDNTFNLEQTFKIKTILGNRTKRIFKNSMITSQFLKDGIVDFFRNKYQSRPTVNIKKPDINFLLYIEGDEDNQKTTATVLLDLCGYPLSNRGYRDRQLNFKAPLRENLAAGIILNTNINNIDNKIFIDSMCGSGTLLIEAVLIKANIPSQYLRIRQIVEKGYTSWNFFNHSWFREDRELTDKFETLLNDHYNAIIEKINTIPSNYFFGYDLSNNAVNIAKKNISNALIPHGTVKIKTRDALKIKSDIICVNTKMSHGTIVCNPPYGERLGEITELTELYHEYGENLKNNFKGFEAFILTGNLELRKSISLQTSKRIKLFNGDIECRLFKYDLY